MTLRNFIIILLLTASYNPISAQTLQNFVFFNAELSVQMALTAVQDCQEKGYNVSAAVMNREGRLTAFARNPMASPMTSEIAQGKAYAAALTQASTAKLGESVPWPMQMESSQRKGVFLLAIVNVFSKESEFQGQIRQLMKSAPKMGLIQ